MENGDYYTERDYDEVKTRPILVDRNRQFDSMRHRYVDS